MTIFVNFAHPLTTDQITGIEEKIKTSCDEVREISVHFDLNKPFAEQVVALVDCVGFTPEEWQTLPILINPPAHAVIAVALLAELHGRMGYFPSVIRLRPVSGSMSPAFEVAEIIQLQDLRAAARQRR